MTSKHTPGEWEIVGHAICVGDLDVARIYHPKGMDVHEFQSNARLISAAPDLLAALILSDRVFRSLGFISTGEQVHPGSLGSTIKSAITKATGESA